MKSRLSLLPAALILVLTASAPVVRAQTVANVTILHSFNGTDGSQPPAALVLGKDGDFYGVTAYGGTTNNGTAFKLTPDGTTFSTLHNFSAPDGNGNNSDGATPYASLIQARDGNFYGTTENGGISDSGTIFKMTPAGVLSTLHTLAGGNTEGYDPEAALVQGSDGSFYGTTVNGGGGGYGTVFKVTPGGTFSTVYGFSYYDGNGFNPYAGLTLASDGNFYGATQGGYYFLGALFKLTPDGTLTLVHRFENDDGSHPMSTPVQGRDGNFYGTTEAGGVDNVGTVFKVAPDGTLTSLYGFGSTANGGTLPDVGLLLGTDGNFYGTTQNGGAGGEGTVYKITPDGTFTILYNFSPLNNNINSDGAAPHAALIQGSDGNFYGTTTSGGMNGDGTIFKLVTASPTVYNPATARGTQDTALSYQITATSNPTSFGATGLPKGLTINGKTGLISGTPTVPGTYTLTLKAVNASGSGTATVTLVIAPDKVPTITSPATAIGKVGNAFSYRITASEAPTRYGAQGLPAGLAVDSATGIISGTPTAPGTFKPILLAYNTVGNSSATLTLTIRPLAPVITSDTEETATEGLAYSYQITATNNPTSYSVGGLPQGLKVDTKTGLITGKPTMVSGTKTLTLRATNTGGTGTTTLTLTINQQIPVITSSKTATGTAGQPFSYQITASNDPATFGALGLRGGLTVNAKTGVISGTPPSAATFTVTLKATNSAGTGTQSLALTINP